MLAARVAPEVCISFTSFGTRPNPGPYGDVWPTNNNREQRSGRRDQAIAVESTNRLDRYWGWEAESSMRVASLESVLTAATLVSAIVVVLWGIKIFLGA
jgi:hypothetical protein